MQFNIPAEFKHASGVYVIRNSVNNKVYVGSAAKLRRRFYEHRRALQHDNHYNKRLQRLANKYGLNTLAFELLELTPLERQAIISCEQKWLDELRPCLRENGYNTLPTAGSPLGYKWSPERKAKAKLARKPMSPEQREKFLEYGKKPRSQEARAKMSASRKGLKLNLTAEQRQKVLSRLAQPLSPEAEQRRRDNFKAYYENKPKQQPIELTCSNCGIIFFRPPYLVRKCCGVPCSNKFRAAKSPRQQTD